VTDRDGMYVHVTAKGAMSFRMDYRLNGRQSISANMDPEGLSLARARRCSPQGPTVAIRLSVLWKAAVGDSGERADSLTLDRIMEIFVSDLKEQQVEFQVPSDPLTDTA
jgi:hypothetical protein